MGGDSGRQVKREKIDDDDDEEMEIDEEEDTPQQDATISLSGKSRYYLDDFTLTILLPKATAVPPTIQHPTARLLCTNLPQEVTDNVLSVLFQQ
jgi:U2 small nuclear ribonucleoprotein B''